MPHTQKLESQAQRRPGAYKGGPRRPVVAYPLVAGIVARLCVCVINRDSNELFPVWPMSITRGRRKWARTQYLAGIHDSAQWRGDSAHDLGPVLQRLALAEFGSVATFQTVGGVAEGLVPKHDFLIR